MSFSMKDCYKSCRTVYLYECTLTTVSSEQRMRGDLSCPLIFCLINEKRKLQQYLTLTQAWFFWSTGKSPGWQLKEIKWSGIGWFKYFQCLHRSSFNNNLQANYVYRYRLVLRHWSTAANLIKLGASTHLNCTLRLPAVTRSVYTASERISLKSKKLHSLVSFN